MSNKQQTTNNPPKSSLLLLMLGVRADHPHDPLAADDLAILTDSFNAASYFHNILIGPVTIMTGESSTLSQTKLKLK
jgi:hypothetical protein